MVNEPGRARFVCRCDCGTEKIISSGNLGKGKSNSCGCLQREGATARLNANRKIKHGMKRRGNPAPEYAVWSMMKKRCHDPEDKDYRHYGGRGIVVCQRWRDSFENFIADMGRRPPGLTLERKDNSKGYEPSNCKWATWTEQAKNRRH